MIFTSNSTCCVDRGYSLIDNRHGIAVRFRKSWRGRTKLLVVPDFDRERENIAETLAASLCDDFGIGLAAYKVALTTVWVRE